MGYRDSTLIRLTSLRRAGQKPDGPVIVGDAAWASRNRFFHVAIGDLADDFTALKGLPVIVRMVRPYRYRDLWQRMVLALGPVCVFDTEQGRSEWLTA